MGEGERERGERRGKEEEEVRFTNKHSKGSMNILVVNKTNH